MNETIGQRSLILQTFSCNHCITIKPNYMIMDKEVKQKVDAAKENLKEAANIAQ